MPAKKSLLAQAQAVVVQERDNQPTIETRRINVPASRLEEFTKAIETQFPDAVLNENAIAKGGKTASDDPICVFAVVQKNPTGTASVYYTGKASLSGAMCALDW
jgi:hypothetical protein